MTRAERLRERWDALASHSRIVEGELRGADGVWHVETVDGEEAVLWNGDPEYLA